MIRGDGLDEDALASEQAASATSVRTRTLEEFRRDPGFLRTSSAEAPGQD